MSKKTVDLPLIARQAEVVADSINTEAREIDIVWTTGAMVQRVRWEGWDDRIEYDEELVVSPNAIRLDRLNAGAPFLNSHQSWGLESVIGSVIEGSVRIEKGQGTARIRLTGAADAADVVHRILEKTVRHVSVGYKVHQYDITKKDGERELWRAVDWEPYEISAVAMPADAGAHIRAEGGATKVPPMTPCVLTRQDLPAADAALTRGVVMNDKTKAAGGAETDPNLTNDQQRQAALVVQDNKADIEAERQRSLTITQMVRQHGLDAAFGDALIADGTSLDAARTQVLAKLAERAPKTGASEISPGQARGDGATEIAYRDAMTAAMMHRHDPNGQKMTEDAREFRGLSLVELARHALDRRGINTRGMSKMEVSAAAFEMRSAGYHTTSDFPSILANVANKTLRTAYESTTRTFIAWARRATIVDFKQVARNQLGGAPDLLKVNEAGEIKYGTMGEKKEVYALASYGRIIPLTRQVLINDDMDAFTRVPAAFGASAADLESDLVYANLSGAVTMADGVALFHATHGNLAGAGTAIDEASLAAAYRAMGAQEGIEGRLIRALPEYIIVPPGKRSVEARKQVTATTPASTADVNVHAGRLTVIEEPRLIPAAGNDPWFLASDYNRIDTVEYAYLEGQEGVYTETRMGFDRDGMEIKARHDFATKAIDWLGLYKNPGAA